MLPNNVERTQNRLKYSIKEQETAHTRASTILIEKYDFPWKQAINACLNVAHGSLIAPDTV